MVNAVLAVEQDHPNLKGKLPRDYARRGIEPVKLKGLIDLIADIGFKGGSASVRERIRNHSRLDGRLACERRRIWNPSRKLKRPV